MITYLIWIDFAKLMNDFVHSLSKCCIWQVATGLDDDDDDRFGKEKSNLKNLKLDYKYINCLCGFKSDKGNRHFPGIGCLWGLHM